MAIANLAVYGFGYLAAALFIGFGLLRVLTFFHVRQEGNWIDSFYRWLWWWGSNGLTVFIFPDSRMLTDKGKSIFRLSRNLFFASLAIMIFVVLVDSFYLATG
ncbi:hypothetical protein PUV54_13465 [Hyphococcus flavus]|uniref:Uncharacterized protein n=1 Tax=Hyphococcus flavus TaxID=1866326 RepID=A0AAE9ZE26_9PROT|nr:hypothetical protein [Hyphococcus flavus]WDI30963.1 hypothetical protein PUV54_13465 [Hyphococcus flavus]